MPPQTGCLLELVLGQQLPAIRRDDLDGLQQVVEDRFADEVVEVDPNPAGLDALAPACDLTFELVRGVQIDSQQPVPVGTGAGAAAARLDPEEIVEQRDDVVVVQVAPAMADHERNDREPLRATVAEDLDVGVSLPALDGAIDERFLALTNRLDADLLLELEHEARSN